MIYHARAPPSKCPCPTQVEPRRRVAAVKQTQATMLRRAPTTEQRRSLCYEPPGASIRRVGWVTVRMLLQGIFRSLFQKRWNPQQELFLPQGLPAFLLSYEKSTSSLPPRDQTDKAGHGHGPPSIIHILSCFSPQSLATKDYSIRAALSRLRFAWANSRGQNMARTSFGCSPTGASIHCFWKAHVLSPPEALKNPAKHDRHAKNKVQCAEHSRTTPTQLPTEELQNSPCR